MRENRRERYIEKREEEERERERADAETEKRY